MDVTNRYISQLRSSDRKGRHLWTPCGGAAGCGNTSALGRPRSGWKWMEEVQVGGSSIEP